MEGEGEGEEVQAKVKGSGGILSRILRSVKRKKRIGTRMGRESSILRARFNKYRLLSRGGKRSRRN